MKTKATIGKVKKPESRIPIRKFSRKQLSMLQDHLEWLVEKADEVQSRSDDIHYDSLFYRMPKMHTRKIVKLHAKMDKAILDLAIALEDVGGRVTEEYKKRY